MLKVGGPPFLDSLILLKMEADGSTSPVRPNTGEAGNQRRFYESLSQKPVLTVTRARNQNDFPPLFQALEKDRNCFVNETSDLIMIISGQVGIWPDVLACSVILRGDFNYRFFMRQRSLVWYRGAEY